MGLFVCEEGRGGVDWVGEWVGGFVCLRGGAKWAGGWVCGGVE